MTNHKEASLAALEKAKTSIDPEGAKGWLGVAQTEATLALTEQQRIANLIAYKDNINTFQRNGYALDADTQRWLDTASDQIIEGLGL